MKPRYTAPPYQPKWILQLQVFLLRRLPMGEFSKRTMVITTTGRKTGRQHSVPIGYIRDGESYLTVNMGGQSNWYKNALANPQVKLEIGTERIEACAEAVPVNTPEQLHRVLDVYERESPGMLTNFFNIRPDTSQDELMQLGQYAYFMRFYKVGA